MPKFAQEKAIAEAKVKDAKEKQEKAEAEAKDAQKAKEKAEAKSKAKEKAEAKAPELIYFNTNSSTINTGNSIIYSISAFDITDYNDEALAHHQMDME